VARASDVPPVEEIPRPTLSCIVVANPYEIRRWCQRLICDADLDDDGHAIDELR